MIDDPVTARRLRDAMPVFTALATCLLVLAIGAILSLGRDVLMPITLAVLLSFVLAPAVRACSAGACRGRSPCSSSCWRPSRESGAWGS